MRRLKCLKQAEKKSTTAKSKTVPLSSAEYKAVKKDVSAKNKQQSRKIPQTAQQSIPFDHMTKDGIAVTKESEKVSVLGFLFGKQKPTEARYSKTVQFYQADYEISDVPKQQSLFAKYCNVINLFDSTIKFQISTISLTSEDDIEDIIKIPDTEDEYTDIRTEYCEYLRERIAEGSKGLVKVNYITFSVTADNIKKARNRLVSIEKDIIESFAEMDVTAVSLNGEERLFVMYKMLHQYSDEPFFCNMDTMAKSGIMPKDYIAPSSLNFSDENCFKCGKFYGSTFAINLVASEISDRFLTSIMDSENPMAFNMHLTAVDTIEAKKFVKNKLSNLEKGKIDMQKQAVQKGYDMDILPPDMKTFITELNTVLDELENKNERMFIVTLLVTNFAKSRKALEAYNESLKRNIVQANSALIPLDYMQDLAFTSMLPLAENRIMIERRLTTSSVAIFLPFTVKDISMDGEAICYGINPVSGNPVYANRKQLANPNAVILGTPGGGKSMATKCEISNNFLFTNDDIFICDPEDEYHPLVKEFNGQVIDISSSSDNYINPMDIEIDTDDDDVIGVKSEFILSLCELIVGGKGLDSEEISIIDRCVRELYTDYLTEMAYATEEDFKANMPILSDLQRKLYESGAECAKRVANSLEIYTTGSLNIFNHRTNIDLNNRLICFNIKKLKGNLRKIGMLVIQDQVWNRVAKNRGRKYTWYYMDEFHLLLKEEQTAKYSVEMWKRFRKWHGIPTGITQNANDFLSSPDVETIFKNSDCIIMLRQAAGDIDILAERLNISPTQQKYIEGEGKRGCGLIYFGGRTIPFDNTLSTDMKLYKLMTTKPEEALI